MTNPNTQAPARVRSRTDEDSITDWIIARQRDLTWGLVAIVVIAGGLWFYKRSQTLKDQHAEAAYFQARRSEAAGNLPLAVSDFRKVATRYAGTRSGTQASMSLAQGLYEQKKFKEGIDALKEAEGKAPEDFVPSIHVLEAAGYNELKNFLAAAEQYKLAAQATKFPAEKAHYQNEAALSYMTAGKLAEAKAIWTELAKDDTSPDAAEARVRLGEVSAQPMKI